MRSLAFISALALCLSLCSCTSPSGSSIDSIKAGSGLSGGGASGEVSLQVDFGGTGSATTVAHSDHNHSGAYVPVSAESSCSGTDKMRGVDPATGRALCAADVSNPVGLAGSGSAVTAARSDHDHSGTYLPRGTNLSCAGGSFVSGLSGVSGDLTCTPVPAYTDAQAVSAMGAKANANPLNHDRYTDAEAVAAMGAKANANPRNHDRYTDAEAVAAMGAKANANPRNHDRYTDTEAVAAVTAQTVTHYLTYGPEDFALAKRDGTALTCGLPGGNCMLPVGVLTNLHLPLRIPAPATLLEVGCSVLDDDPGATNDVTLTAHNPNITIGTASTSGAAGGQRVVVTGLSSPITENSRGSPLTITFKSGPAAPVMMIFDCYAKYQTNGL